MKDFLLASRGVWGLFVDDGDLALFLLALVAAVTAMVKLVGLPPLLGAGILVLGCIGILVQSLLQAARRSSRQSGSDRSKH